ncbi:hypothetical protein EXIGLDRAFT_603577 [Exidia glandulosa HHB12029]|uniref:Uncharacterized protein n=1 Tax=Exidia glandulosa HHB12029 TaxID=1314781 RepID=A0A165NKN6_EXIGL|nr:hypothetical protein EXIGLDRAFT_603577 [Exidia glandulosa HHB12029]
MTGLRLFAAGILNQTRKIELEIPEECEHYMNTLHTQYLVHPSAPLITDPHACGFLSANAVKKNLVEHAKYDASIQVKGAKGELILALRELLERRRADMQVRAVLWKMDEDQETPQSDTALQNAEEDDEQKTEYTYSS